jgi:hypothetical protein
MMQTMTYTMDQLAVAFQRSSATLRQHLDMLSKTHGFPERLPLFDGLWSRPAVDAWFAANGKPQAASDLSPATGAPPELAYRYGDTAGMTMGR